MSYRTASIKIYDVLDTQFVNLVITEYNGTPGMCEPDVFSWSASSPSHGDDHWSAWLVRALSTITLETERP